MRLRSEICYFNSFLDFFFYTIQIPMLAKKLSIFFFWGEECPIHHNSLNAHQIALTYIPRSNIFIGDRPQINRISHLEPDRFKFSSDSSVEFDEAQIKRTSLPTLIGLWSINAFSWYRMLRIFGKKMLRIFFVGIAPIDYRIGQLWSSRNLMRCGISQGPQPVIVW